MNTGTAALAQLLKTYLRQELADGTYDRIVITRLPPAPARAVKATPTAAPAPPAPAQLAAAPPPRPAAPPQPSVAADGLLHDDTPRFVPPAGDRAAQLQALRCFIGDCQRCPALVRNRTTIVFGCGNPHAGIMFVGEAPGADEDVQGLPFVGRAGQLLTNIIEKGMHLRRDDVYIANILKCRPPNNREPQPHEVANCTPFLHEQLAIVKPRVIVALGTYAAHYLTGSATPISKLRGTFHQYRGIPVMPTFHPAYLLRNYSPENRRMVWDDMKKVLEYVRG